MLISGFDVEVGNTVAARVFRAGFGDGDAAAAGIDPHIERVAALGDAGGQT